MGIQFLMRRLPGDLLWVETFMQGFDSKSNKLKRIILTALQLYTIAAMLNQAISLSSVFMSFPKKEFEIFLFWGYNKLV
jgi:hypothetical protein